MTETPISQIEPTQAVKNVSINIEGEGIDFLKNVDKYINKNLEFRLFKGNEEHEKSIRWTRSADQILKDGYVYDEKSCTDLVVTFQAICEAKGYETNFVKVKGKDRKGIHSFAEVNVNDNWYLVDVGGNGEIRKEQLKEGEIFNGWILWKRGKSAWDLGLKSFDDWRKID